MAICSTARSLLISHRTTAIWLLVVYHAGLVMVLAVEVVIMAAVVASGVVIPAVVILQQLFLVYHHSSYGDGSSGWSLLLIAATVYGHPIWDTGHMRIWGHLTPFCVHFKPFWASGTPILGSWGTPILGYPPSTDPRPAGRGSIFAIFLTLLNMGF